MSKIAKFHILICNTVEMAFNLYTHSHDGQQTKQKSLCYVFVSVYVNL